MLFKILLLETAINIDISRENIIQMSNKHIALLKINYLQWNIYVHIISYSLDKIEFAFALFGLNNQISRQRRLSEIVSSGEKTFLSKLAKNFKT